MNKALFDTLSSFNEKIKYIAIELNGIAQMANPGMDEEKMYEIIEPYMNALIDSTKVADESEKVGRFVDEGERQTMFQAIRDGKKINAIKCLRGMFRERYVNQDGHLSERTMTSLVGLKEAKDEIERVTFTDSSNSTGRMTTGYWEFEGVLIYDESRDGTI